MVTYGAALLRRLGADRGPRAACRGARRRLSLDELVAGALILYPAYVDPVTGLACDAETAAWRLGEARDGARHPRSRRRLRALVENLWARARTAGPPGFRSAG